ncbi:MAG: hypothetical protein KatS3mg105_4384 [Gemmatales bacterium]|nr:MAG: hypothetical protein KatS3mg105_4384 [Gemmatales bacterium]
MSPVQASCPSCGGPVQFKIGSAMVVVCDYCRSVVARGDRKLEDLGKVAAVTETGAILATGLKGKYEGVPFEITGRVQLAHPAGGVWDEWYAAFADNRWGWLAEAQGRYYLTFEQPSPPPGSIPRFEDLEIGQAISIPSATIPLLVAEKGKARPIAAEGEIPYRFRPGEEYEYADLSAAGGLFGTIDYSEETPKVFGGRQVTLDDLGIPKSARKREREARRIEAIHVNCPQCAGPLELHAPDDTERVGCPNCGALLDVNEGQLRYLTSLEDRVEPVLPLGTTGHLPQGEFIVIGFMQRSVTFEGIDYFWHEYLLYNREIGFRWLVYSDNHFSFVEPIPPGDVIVQAQKAYYKNEVYRIFQKADATVRYVAGEFYWKVQIGEVVEATDFIHPPRMLSREISRGAESSEVNWSLGTYLPVADVEKAFGVSGLPAPYGVAPNQPFLYKNIYQSWGILLVVAFLAGGLNYSFTSSRQLLAKAYTFPPGSNKATFETEAFELESRKNVMIRVDANVNNSWLFVNGDVVNLETQKAHPFLVQVSYYYGYSGGEHWREGSRSNYTFLSAPGKGKYKILMVVERGGGTLIPGVSSASLPDRLQLYVEQGKFRWLYWILLFVAISILPLCVAIYHLVFEGQRWQDSEFNPYSE